MRGHSPRSQTRDSVWTSGNISSPKEPHTYSMHTGNHSQPVIKTNCYSLWKLTTSFHIPRGGHLSYWNATGWVGRRKKPHCQPGSPPGTGALSCWFKNSFLEDICHVVSPLLIQGFLKHLSDAGFLIHHISLSHSGDICFYVYLFIYFDISGQRHFPIYPSLPPLQHTRVSRSSTLWGIFLALNCKWSINSFLMYLSEAYLLSLTPSPSHTMKTYTHEPLPCFV